MSFSRGLLTWEEFECIFLACHVKLEMKKGGSLTFSRKGSQGKCFHAAQSTVGMCCAFSWAGFHKELWETLSGNGDHNSVIVESEKSSSLLGQAACDPAFHLEQKVVCVSESTCLAPSSFPGFFRSISSPSWWNQNTGVLLHTRGMQNG